MIGPEGGRQRERERERRCDRKGLILGVTKSMDELDWVVRCKGCGELYVLREVGAEETTFTVAQHDDTLSQGAYGRVVSVIRDGYGTLLQDLRA
jgi:hypothetical protein